MSLDSSFPPLASVDVEPLHGSTEAVVLSAYEEACFAIKSDLYFEDPYTLHQLSAFVKLLGRPSVSKVVEGLNLRQRFIAELAAVMNVAVVGVRTRFALFKAIDALDPEAECSVAISGKAARTISRQSELVESVEKYFDFLKKLDRISDLPHVADHYKVRDLAFLAILRQKEQFQSGLPAFPMPAAELSQGENENIFDAAFLEQVIFKRDFRVVERYTEQALVRVTESFGEHSLEPNQAMN